MIDIPNYEIGKLAGRGGVAEVYLARHKLLDRTVAIKLISPSNADDLADKRFLKEAKVVAGLRHPNIVSIYDVGVYENKYYIIMEYLEGGDLKQNLQRSLSIPQTIKILRQITSALAAAHDKGFIHRDIKSQNIMFRADGTAVLTDFGIVKDLTADSGYTMDGTSIGTPHYMSPEQAQGAGEIDWRTDLYSLGVTFYEMLTGAVPYIADSAIAVALKHIKDPVPQLPEPFSEFQPIIDKLMAKNPDDRFQSAHDLLVAIQKLEGGGTPTTVIRRSQKSVRKVNLANIFFGVVIGSLLGGIVFLGQPYLARMMGLEESSVNDTRASTVPHNPADPESKKPFLDAIKKNFTPGVDSTRLTDLIIQRNYPEALRYISDVRQDLPQPSDEMVRQADQFLAKNQTMNAGDIYNTVLSADPENPSALMGLVYVAVEKQQALVSGQKATIAEYETLLALLDKGIENTDSPYFKHLLITAVESVYETANRELAQNRFKTAGAWAKTGLNYAPNHLRLKKLDYLIQARDSFHANRLTLPEQDNALSYYRQILRMDPEDPLAKQGIADIVDKLKAMAVAAQAETDYPAAQQWVEKARAIAADDPDLKITERLISADLHMARGEFKTPEKDNALSDYQQVLAQAPENKQARLGIAKIDVYAPLYKIQQPGPLSGKITDYRTLFLNLKSAIADHGEPDMADVKQAVIDQIKQDMTAQKNQKQPVSAEFLSLVSTYFPGEKDIFNTRYDILMAQGEQSTSKKEKTDYFLSALELSPGKSPAIRKIENLAKALDDEGKADDAKAVLKRAMAVAPNHAPFNEMYQKIKLFQDTNAEIFTLLLNIKKIPDITEKITPYADLFSRLNAAERTYGSQKMAGLKQDVTSQIKDDIQGSKNRRQLIPDEFIALISTDFPGMDEYVASAQYDILIEKGELIPSTQEKADYFLKALKLDNQRKSAREKIELLATALDQNGNNPAAVAVLQQAMAVSPNDLIFSDLFGKLHHTVDIFATTSGCDERNIITQAPVSVEYLNLCIKYRNMATDSIVTVVLNHMSGQNMEIPVVLDGRSGNKPVEILAPVEGFATGEYAISVRQGEKILSETLIQFLSQRR